MIMLYNFVKIPILSYAVWGIKKKQHYILKRIDEINNKRGYAITI